MKNIKRFSWDFWGIVILLLYTTFQVTRWPLFPQHLDIYYHLLTAWGFIQAGGYTNWDFWQYAPIGRPHIYPPLFHMMLAIPMKAGIDKIFLAKVFSVVMPPVFLLTLWSFIRNKFSSRLAFFSLITVGSSFSFFMSLTNHIPSTIAMVFGIIAIWQFMDRKYFRALILFALCFYTHIGTSWFLLLTMLLFSLTDRQTRRPGFIISIAALALASPVFINQLANIKALSVGPTHEKYFCEYKTLDYLLAAFGFVLALRKGKKYLLLSAFLAASFIYINYPARLFSSEGYIAIALLAAVSLDVLWEDGFKRRYLKIAAAFLIIFMSVFSPTFVMGENASGLPDHKLFVFDSVTMNMIFPEANERMISRTLWLKKYYDYAVRIIQENSSRDDIIYCDAEVTGMCLAAVSGRATANHLFSEISPPKGLDPLMDSKVIVLLKYHSPERIKLVVERYHLVLMGENDMFYIYKNSRECPKVRIRKAVVPFNPFAS